MEKNIRIYKLIIYTNVSLWLLLAGNNSWMDVFSSVVELLPSTQEALDSAPELPINKVRTDQVS